MKENGDKIKLMEKEHIYISMVLDMKEMYIFVYLLKWLDDR